MTASRLLWTVINWRIVTRRRVEKVACAGGSLVASSHVVEGKHKFRARHSSSNLLLCLWHVASLTACSFFPGAPH